MEIINSELSNNLIKSYKKCKETRKKRALYLKVFEQTSELVKQIVNQFAAFSDIAYEDLMQIGFLGLMKAIESYNTKKHSNFLTYATYFIKGEILHYMRDKANIIKIPRIKNGQSNIESEDDFENISEEKLLELISNSKKDVQSHTDIEHLRKLISLDQKLHFDNDDFLLIDKVPSENYQDLLKKYEDKIMIKEVINKLPENLKRLILMSYFKDMSQRDIAKTEHMSQMQVSRGIRKALNEMYNNIKDEG